MGERRDVYRILVGKPEEKRIILRWVLRKWHVLAWPGLISLRIGTDGGHLVRAVMDIRVP
jgi:hypothetical protein